MDSRNSKVILAKGIAMDETYNNVLNYTETQMLALLRSQAHLVTEKTGYSFIRDTGYIEMQVTYATALSANYLAFQNVDYSNKWFFAWIDDVEYRGDNNTRIKYTIDCWSTWFDKWTAKKCFIKRHHVNDDTIGANRVPENIAINNIIELSETEDTAISGNFYVALQTSWILKDSSEGGADDGEQFDGITVYNKQIYGTKLVLFGEFVGDLIDHASGVTPTDLAKYHNILGYIKRTNTDGHIGDIENLFIVPSAVIKPAYLTSHTAYAGSTHDTDHTINFYTIAYTDKPETVTHTISKVSSYTDYTPKNNKCFTYPWNYLYVTNNNGNSNIYKYEDFSDTNATFTSIYAMAIGCSAKLYPTNYKGQSYDCDNGFSIGKFPVCGWSSDAFTNWLTSQAVNIATSWIRNVNFNSGNNQAQQTGAEAGTLGAAQMGVSIAGKIADTIGAFYTGSLMPNISGGNNNTADTLWADKKNGLVFRNMRCSLEDLKIADDYFTRFGYAIKKLEMPNITGRTYWNYVEIGDSEEIGYGDVPNKFMDVINKVARRGVTIWHSHDNIGNWDLANTIVTPTP